LLENPRHKTCKIRELLPGHHQRPHRGTRPQGGSELAPQTCSSWTGTSHTMMPQNGQQPRKHSGTDLSSLIFLWIKKGMGAEPLFTSKNRAPAIRLTFFKKSPSD